MDLLFLAQIISILWFAFSSLRLNISVGTVLSFTACIVIRIFQSWYKLQRTPSRKLNPFKSLQDEELSEELLASMERQVLEYQCDFAPEEAACLEDFKVVSSASDCLFAKRARLWGSGQWNKGLQIEGNVTRLAPVFYRFCLECRHRSLDGFVLQLPPASSSDLKTFGESVRRALVTLSALDPSGARCMAKSYVHRTGWVFRFDELTFFITSFAPFYPVTHPRYAFGAEHGYILFQPEVSFARHDLPADTAHTNWTCPRTVRDRIRIQFRDAAREYVIRPDVRYPMVWDIVRPLDPKQQYYPWWLQDPDNSDTST